MFYGCIILAILFSLIGMYTIYRYHLWKDLKMYIHMSHRQKKPKRVGQDEMDLCMVDDTN